MSGFLNKVALFALLALASPAYAAPAAAPHDLSTAPEEEDSDAAPSVGYTEKPPVAVSTEPISKPPTDGFGVLDENSGGIAGAWNGSTRDTMDFPLEQIDTGIANETLRNLLVKLLMTQSAPPQGRSDTNWLALRLNALIAIGQDDKALQMISALPPSVASQAMIELQAELELVQGNYDKACAHARPADAAADEKAAMFWQKLNVVCEAHNGKHDQAMLGLDMLNETNASSALFQDEIHHTLDKNAQVRATAPRKLSLFDFAVVQMAGDTERLKDKVDSLPAIAIKYLAQNQSIDPKLREKAIARAIQLGLLPTPEGSKPPEQPFAKTLVGDVTTLVTALQSDNPVNEADNGVIARLALDDAGVQDSRRIERLLTLMQIFGYKIPETTWQKLLSHKMRYDGEVPAAMWMQRLEQAVAMSRKGEVVVLSSLIFTDQSADKMSDLELVPVVKSLKLLGFEKEARAIAANAVENYK